ncbi:MAG: hypothetical protein ACE5IY_14880 [bacterium]
MTKHALNLVLGLVLLSSCTRTLVQKDFDDLVLFAFNRENSRVDLTNSSKMPVLQKYNFDDDKTYLEVILDLKDARTLRLVDNILKKNIEAYIVIKDLKGRDIARQEIMVHDDDVVELIKRRKHAFTGALKYLDEEDTVERVTYNDSVRYLPQYVFIDEAGVFENGVYALYIQGNLWKENKTALMNICTTPKFISIESTDDVIGIDTYFDRIKFFVSGYYRPTTRENLVDLQFKIQEGRVNLPMENITQLDRDNVGHVENAFDTLYKESQKAFEKYIRQRKAEHLRIEFEGRTDPRPISAKYLEETVVFENNDPEFPDIEIETGVTMDNVILSQLRAYYTMEYVDALFSKSIQYQQLKDQGRIHFRVIGTGPVGQPDGIDQQEMAKARRVEVRIKRISPPKPDVPPGDVTNK